MHGDSSQCHDVLKRYDPFGAPGALYTMTNSVPNAVMVYDRSTSGLLTPAGQFPTRGKTFYAGIHFLIDVDQGLALGNSVAQIVVQEARVA